MVVKAERDTPATASVVARARNNLKDTRRSYLNRFVESRKTLQCIQESSGDQNAVPPNAFSPRYKANPEERKFEDDFEVVNGRYLSKQRLVKPKVDPLRQSLAMEAAKMLKQKQKHTQKVSWQEAGDEVQVEKTSSAKEEIMKTEKRISGREERETRDGREHQVEEREPDIAAAKQQSSLNYDINATKNSDGKSGSTASDENRKLRKYDKPVRKRSETSVLHRKIRRFDNEEDAARQNKKSEKIEKNEARARASQKYDSIESAQCASCIIQ